MVYVAKFIYLLYFKTPIDIDWSFRHVRTREIDYNRGQVTEGNNGGQ